MTNQAQTKPASFPLRQVVPLGCLVLCLSACSKEPEPAAAAPSGSKAKSGFIAHEANSQTNATSGPPRSVFTTGKGARDPFFPQAAPAAEETSGSVTAAAAPQTVDVVALLQEGLQWVVGSGSQRLALLNDVTLEPNKTARVPITHAGKQQLVTVRCIAINKNSVTLQVQGQSSPVTISKIPKK